MHRIENLPSNYFLLPPVGIVPVLQHRPTGVSLQYKLRAKSAGARWPTQVEIISLYPGVSWTNHEPFDLGQS